jgi:ABC-type nitrate/sulfonate/bicarbonate transport system permease component
MNTLRKLLLWMTSGGLLGGFFSSLVARSVAPTFYAPISKQVSATLCDCAAAALAAESMFRWTFIGIISGMVVGLVLGLLAAMAREKKPDAAPPSASTKAG